MKTILFIDGRNFISKINSILNPNTENKREIDFSIYNFAGLFNKVLSEIKVDRKIFYIGRIITHEGTKEKSTELIQKQRLLKTNLKNSKRGGEKKCTAIPASPRRRV